jgi:hypothetical protein
MGLVPDEGAVPGARAGIPDRAFGDRVHRGRADVAEHGPDPGTGEDRVEYCGDVRAAVADQELDPVRLLAQVHEQVACLLGGPRPGAILRDSADADAPVPLEYSIGGLICAVASGLDAVWLAGRVLLKVVYLLTRRILGLAVLVFRGDLAKDAEVLVLRQENAVLRRQAGRVRYEPADRAWFAALARLIPRRHWTEIFPVTPATLLAWHHKLTARKYDTSWQHKPGRPPAAPGIARLVVRLAKENPLWDTAGSTAS